MPITLTSVTLVVGALLLGAASIWNCFVWFRQGVSWLLLCLLVPFAGLVFLVKFWSEAKRPFFLGLAGSALVLTTLLWNAKGSAQDFRSRFATSFLPTQLRPTVTSTGANPSPPLATTRNSPTPATRPSVPAARTTTTMTPVALATADVTTPSPPSGVLARELQGAGVGRFQDGRWQPLPAGALEGKRHFAFYYSAHWCPPCRAFTPKLVAFYQSFTASHPDFELVFVSSDHSEAEMRKYMQEAGMPWPAVPFAKAQTAHLPRSTGNGIPCLVLADAEGRVLADSYAGATYLGPGKVLTDIGKLPVGGAGAPAPLLAAVNNPPKPAATAPEKSSDGLRREMAAAATAERRGAYDKHRAEADALYNDLNVRRAKLKGADAAAVAAFNADAARYAALLEQTKVELGALGPVTPTLTAAESVVPSSQPGGPKFTGPTSPDAKRGPVYVPGVVGGNPNGTKPTTSTTPGENPGLYRRSLDKARAARDAAVSNGAEALR